MGVAEFALMFSLLGLFLLAPSAYFEFRRLPLNPAPYISTGLACGLYHLAEFEDVLIFTMISFAMVGVLHVLLVFEQRRQKKKK